ncbi:hypothetical protein Tsp_10773 [Trichinella spiralis]|uniref:hypothetical protein n=1 Tax=Trichinella spiralis TaxID=6334 RepID=UPI0001EFD4E9|nr:hypothetical protein Tsp_10773 [Trichinella spiralis]
MCLTRCANNVCHAHLSVKAKVWSNYFISVRRVSLTCKFSCVHCLAVCLLIKYSSSQESASNIFKKPLRSNISARASGGKCLERRFTSPVGTPSQRGELQCQPCPGPPLTTLAGQAPIPPPIQPRPPSRHHQKPAPKSKAP